MVISGDGTITGLAAGGLPDNSITQAEIATGVAGKGPLFFASQSVSQTGITPATATKITFTTEAYDTASCYDTTTSRFTPNVAGYYLVTSTVTYPDSGGTNGLAIQIRKNATTAIWGTTSRGANGQIFACSNGSVIVLMNGTTDYLEVYGYFATGTTGSTQASVSQTNFSASLIRAA
jgi:hypothetical protein